MSWRYPFFGTAALMAIAFILTHTLVRESGMPEQRGSARDTLRALKDPGLLTLAMGGLLYSFGFFVLLAYTPLLLGISAREIGLIFFGWGILVAITSVFMAPWLRAHYGPTHVVLGVLVLFALDLALMAAGPRSILPATVIASGALLGVNNALFTSLAMEVSTVTRSVASAGYNFLRWAGAAVAPVLSGLLAVAVSPRFPFLLAALSVAGSAALIWLRRAHVTRGLLRSSAATPRQRSVRGPNEPRLRPVRAAARQPASWRRARLPGVRWGSACPIPR
jgi:MFS transporter, ACDE family, multidrug resistance protein